jgi:hypothetical protein
MKRRVVDDATTEKQGWVNNGGKSHGGANVMVRPKRWGSELGMTVRLGWTMTRL